MYLRSEAVAVKGKRLGRDFVCKLQILRSDDPLNPHFPHRCRAIFVQTFGWEFVPDRLSREQIALFCRWFSFNG